MRPEFLHDIADPLIACVKSDRGLQRVVQRPQLPLRHPERASRRRDTFTSPAPQLRQPLGNLFAIAEPDRRAGQLQLIAARQDADDVVTRRVLRTAVLHFRFVAQPGTSNAQTGEAEPLQEFVPLLVTAKLESLFGGQLQRYRRVSGQRGRRHAACDVAGQ